MPPPPPPPHVRQRINQGRRAHQDGNTATTLPERIRNILHPSETLLYASNPSRNALTALMVLNGIVWGLIGLCLYLVGIVVTLPIALFITYWTWKNRYYVITHHRTIVSHGIFNIATKIVPNHNIQLISINTGIIDRLLNLNSIELSTAAQGGAGGIMASFPGVARGGVVLKWVRVEDILKYYGLGKN
jgi:membrane protein YdbS with pleckstrin-like domain